MNCRDPIDSVEQFVWKKIMAIFPLAEAGSWYSFVIEELSKYDNPIADVAEVIISKAVRYAKGKDD